MTVKGIISILYSFNMFFMKNLALVVVIVVLTSLSPSVSSFKVGSLASRSVEVRNNDLMMSKNPQGWAKSSIKSIRKKGAVVLVATGMLIAPRVSNARGSKGSVAEVETSTMEDEYESPKFEVSQRKSRFGFKKKAKVEVVVEDEVEDEYEDEYGDEYEDYDEEDEISATDSDKSRKLTNIGLGAAIGTAIAVFVSGDDDSSNKRKGKRVIASKEPTFKSRLDLNDLPQFERSTNLKSPMGSKLGRDVEDILRPPADLGAKGGNDGKDELFKANREATSKSKKSKAIKVSPTDKFFAENDEEDDDDDDLFASSNRSGAVPNAASALQSAPAPAPAPKKKNLLSRIFSKPGGGRPTDLGVALKEEDEASASFRNTVASALGSYVPEEIFHDWDLSVIDRSYSEEKKAAELKDELETSGMEEQEAADAFAEVANAMLATMTDRAAAALKEKDTEKTLEYLDDLADFVGGAGAVFSATVPGAVIEPVQYNGKTRKGQIENLYLEYLKSTMSLESLMGMMGGLMGGGEEGIVDATAADPAKVAAAEKATEREGKIGRLQQAFAIKEKKKANLESKVMKDLFMNMAKGGEGMPNLGGLMEGLMGGSGGDPAAMEEMLKSMGGEGGMPDFSNLPDFEGMPDMGNMSEEEVQAMSKDAVGAVKASLADGSITKKDVEELEKIMGMDVKTLANMIDNGQVDKQKLAQMGPEFTEMLDLFKQLAKIK